MFNLPDGAQPLEPMIGMSGFCGLAFNLTSNPRAEEVALLIVPEQMPKDGTNEAMRF